MEIEYVKKIVEPILAAGGLFLADLKISRDNVIEVYVDSMTGVDIQTCIDLSKEIEKHLDRDAEDFELTVASAGIGYPFKVEQQYAKNVGKPVEAKLKDGRKIEGVLKAFDAESVTIEREERQAVPGSKKKQTVQIEERIRREELKEIKDVVRW